jgi:RND family efflux transporter MFP subunit
MSWTMILGRVVLPTIGLLLAAMLTWNSVRNVTVRPEVLTASGVSTSQSSGRITAEGRVVAYSGAEVTVGTEVLGTVVNLPVREKAAVHKGDLLVEFRADDVRASLREAHHRLTEAEVNLRVEQLRFQASRLLPAVTGKSAQPADPRRDSLTAVLAHRDAAKAAVDRLEAEVAKYRILAPIDGVIVVRHVDLGETVNVASPLVTIVDLTKLRVEAEVDEFDIPGITPMAQTTITAEGYGGRRWRGEVEEIADTVVARQTRPEDPGRPADTRVLLVKIAFRESCPLKLGQRVEVEIAGLDRDR